MKHNLISIAAALLMTCLLPLAANAQDWQSRNNQNTPGWQTTSSMLGSGSAYSSEVTEVGAVTASDLGVTTTASYSPSKAPGGQIRRSDEWGDNPDAGEGDTGSPIGDGLWVMLLLALAFGGYVYLRKQRALNR